MSQTGFVEQLVIGAFRRSFTAGQADWLITQGLFRHSTRNEELAELQRSAKQHGKLVLFGRPAPDVADWLGLEVSDLPEEAHHWCHADAETQTSAGWIAYRDHPLWQGEPPYRQRWLCRYDFTNEWNNLGYGRITADGGPWSLCCRAQPRGEQTHVLGSIRTADGDQSAFAVLKDAADHAVLWINRPVGTLDGLDWLLVERFLSDYRPEELICLPRLEDVPFGFDATVTMRLDCDQDISSARQLHALYRRFGMPFSLAVLTGLDMDADDLALLDEVSAAGGSLVSHSVTHTANWGGSPEAAKREAAESRHWLEQRLGRGMRHAVSPFHQNPPYAVQALADSGYDAFVAGIICNDPEALTARSGPYPLGEAPPVLVSQQCMLHGDCYHQGGARLSVYQEAFQAHLRARAVFGWLDHPLSSSYQYGWTDLEEQRQAHEDWLSFLQPFYLWRANLSQCLDFATARARIQLGLDANGRPQAQGPRPDGLPPFAIGYKGKIHAV